jgi:ABC-type cobalamin/Fe3+-siderophores transport systems, ATPase components
MPLTAESVTAGYGARRVLHGVSVSADAGAVTVILGPNGSGKSTLLRCLAGALPPASGAVRCDGADLYRLSAARVAQAIAVVPQETPMPFAFTARELIALGANAPGDPVGAEQRARRAATLMDLDPLLDRSVVTLSGGERQRAAVARALAQDTDYLLLDEPTAHLDLKHQGRLFDALRTRAHQEGKGVLVVLHDLAAAAAVADRAVLMRGGEIAAAGEVKNVLVPDTLKSVYEVDIGLLTGDDGRTYLSPFYTLSEADRGAP